MLRLSYREARCNLVANRQGDREIAGTRGLGKSDGLTTYDDPRDPGEPGKARGARGAGRILMLARSPAYDSRDPSSSTVQITSAVTDLKGRIARLTMVTFCMFATSR